MAQDYTETRTHLVLKLLAFLFFRRERLQLEARLADESIPYVPDLVQLDYEMRPVLWVECGECSVAKLDRLAVKAPEAVIWVVKRSPAEVERLLESMAKERLRRQRYHLLALDPEMVSELEGLLRPRNAVFWVAGQVDPPRLQIEFNELWFDGTFTACQF